MNNKSLLFLLITFTTSVFLHTTDVFSYTTGKTYHLTILHTNDTHGQYWKNKNNEFGFAAQNTLVKQIKEEVESNGGKVLVLSAGDINTGSPRSDSLNAVPDILAMNNIGYDAMVIGNHEFDKRNEILKMQQSLATFPFISSNIYNKTTGERAFKSYVDKTIMDDLSVAIVGFTTEDTLKITNPNNIQELEFKPILEEARTTIPDIKKNHDVIIALTHIGYYQDGQNQEKAPGDVNLARIQPEIDIIVGGHTHTRLEKPDIQLGKTIIVQAEDGGKNLGRLDVDFKDGKVSIVSYRLIPINKKIKVVDPITGKEIYKTTRINE